MKLTWTLIMEIGLLVLLVYKTQESYAEIKMTKLFNDLLANYDRNIRPVKNYSQAVSVGVNLKLSQILEVNFDESWMMTRAIVEQEWTDYQLEWSPNSYDYITDIVLPADRVWLPDIAVYNNADGNLRVIPDSVRVHRSGRITASTFAIIKSACDLDKSRFPFDEQNCFLKFGSWTFDGNLLDIQHKHQRPNNATIENGVDLSEYYVSTEWDLSQTFAVRHEKFYSCCPEPYPDLFFNFKLQRRSGSYILNLILPWIIFTFLPIFAFLLPTKSNLKVTYSVFLLLLLLSALAMSGSSTNFPIFLMRKYYLFTTVVVALTLVCSVLIVNVHSRTAASVPQSIRNVSKRLSEYVFLDWPETEGKSTEIELSGDIPDEGHEANQLGKPSEDSEPPNSISEWMHISMVLDRVLLGFFTVVCIIGVFLILI